MHRIKFQLYWFGHYLLFLCFLQYISLLCIALNLFISGGSPRALTLSLGSNIV